MYIEENTHKSALEQAEDSPGFLLWQVAMCWQRNINKVLADHNLTYTQFIVLLITGWLKNSGENIYQHQIAKNARIDRMMTSRIMASLERKHIIKRVKRSDDARTNLILLTPKGDELLKTALEVAKLEQDAFFGPANKIDPNFVNFMQSMLHNC